VSEKDKTFSFYLEKGKTIRKKAKLLTKLPLPPLSSYPVMRCLAGVVVIGCCVILDEYLTKVR
jgi:hypothetical protein